MDFHELDKLRDPEKTLSIFSFSPLYSQPFPVIYSFPVGLTYDDRFGAYGAYRVHPLPMIEVRKIDYARNEDGIRVIRNIVALRADLELFEDKALDELIVKTGGSLRDLFRCIIRAAGYSRYRNASRIEMPDAQQSLTELTSELKKRIESTDYEFIRSLMNDQMKRREIQNREDLLKYMRAGVVIEYNGKGWHAPHPLIEDFLNELKPS